MPKHFLSDSFSVVSGDFSAECEVRCVRIEGNRQRQNGAVPPVSARPSLQDHTQSEGLSDAEVQLHRRGGECRHSGQFQEQGEY